MATIQTCKSHFSLTGPDPYSFIWDKNSEAFLTEFSLKFGRDSYFMASRDCHSSLDGIC